MKVNFVDLGRQYEAHRDEILEAFDRISKQGAYVLGDDLANFESQFADYCDCSYAIGLGNGSDALHLPMLVLGIGEGDEVITAPNSFIASAWAIERTGAKVVFADVGEDMNLSPEKVEAAITPNTKAIMVVHLTGRVADMDAFQAIAEKHDLIIFEDAAQAVGSRRNDRVAGSFGAFAGFSLHPLKNLHVHGDGGVCVTNDQALAEKLMQYRNHGLANRDTCKFWGVNSRLDCIQAAIGSIKLKYIDSWNQRYREIASYYQSELKDLVMVPSQNQNEQPVYHRFMIRSDRRDELKEHLAKQNVGSAINYPIPLHLQPAASHLGYKHGDFPVAEKLASTILSIPIYSELKDEEIQHVVESVKSFF